MSEPYQIEATADGATASIHLPTGIFALEIKADTWDGASATLQEGYGTVFTNSDDPYNTGNALTRTDNGKIIVAQGGCEYRLNVSSFGGSTAGLKLTARLSSE